MVNPRVSFDCRQNAVYSATHGKRIGAVRGSTRTRRGISRTVARSYLEIERGGGEKAVMQYGQPGPIFIVTVSYCVIFFVCRVAMTWLSNLDE